MTQQRIDMLCKALAWLRILLILALPGAVGVVWRLMPVSVSPQSPVAEKPPGDAQDEPNPHELEWYAPLWQRDLKQPPIPLTVAEPTPAPPVKRGSVPVLLATCIEPKGSYAHFMDGHGKRRLLAAGESFGRFTVLAIRAGRVELRDDRGNLWVEVPESKD